MPDDGSLSDGQEGWHGKWRERWTQGGEEREKSVQAAALPASRLTNIADGAAIKAASDAGRRK